MRQLKEPCKSAIENGRCKGCAGLAELDWEEPKRCPYLPSANESIEQIHLNLRNGEKMKILSIDPGNIESAYCIIDTDTYKPLEFGKEKNECITTRVMCEEYNPLIIEMIASYGMPVGKEVFDTCVWIGRFKESALLGEKQVEYIYRKDEKMNLCHSMKAKDSNIRQALIDRFGEVGTKKNPRLVLWLQGRHLECLCGRSNLFGYAEGGNMKVKELIKQLQKYDLEKDVIIRFALDKEDEVGYILEPFEVGSYFKDECAIYANYTATKEDCNFLGQVDLREAYQKMKKENTI